MSQYKFQPNEDLLKQYYAQTPQPQSQETLIDFGIVPTDPLDQEDWQAEVSRFISILVSHTYQFQPTMTDRNLDFCPLYTVRRGSTPVALPHFQWVVNQLCHPGQTTHRVSQVLEIHVLGDGLSLEEIFLPGK